ncbi:MAG: hypothetical protein HFH25_05950 [Lachnospiraceae bacterium]|nr:hypothetical protein [Lachnospiraceae bacterium]
MACGNYKEYCESELYRPQYLESVLSDAEKAEREETRALSRYALIAALVFTACVTAGTLLGQLSEIYVDYAARKQAFAYEADLEEHGTGEEFPLQGLLLTVGEARTLMGPGIPMQDLKEELMLPEGKKLVAVKITGECKDPLAGQMKLKELYIQCGEDYYCQLDYQGLEIYEEAFGTPALTEDSFEDGEPGKVERWASFVVDEEVEGFTLCLEERSGRYLERIQAIHQVPVRLEGTG